MTDLDTQLDDILSAYSDWVTIAGFDETDHERTKEKLTLLLASEKRQAQIDEVRRIPQPSSEVRRYVQDRLTALKENK